MVTKFLYGGYSDVGYGRDANEDSVSVLELDDNHIFAVIADGTGSHGAGDLQPALIATKCVNDLVKRTFDTNPAAFTDNAESFLKEALLSANQVLGAFKIANEEIYNGYASSMTACFISSDRTFSCAHTGNTRLYLIRVHPKDGGIIVKQLTQDQTRGMKLIREGTLKAEDYPFSPERLVILGGLGMVSEPTIQTFSGKIKEKDFLLLTTDGIHYSIRPEPMASLVIAASQCDDAVKALAEAGKTLKYNDNMSSIVIYAVPDDAASATK